MTYGDILFINFRSWNQYSQSNNQNNYQNSNQYALNNQYGSNSNINPYGQQQHSNNNAYSPYGQYNQGWIFFYLGWVGRRKNHNKFRNVI